MLEARSQAPRGGGAFTPTFAVMQALLTVTQGPARTRSVRLRTGETIIGRSRDCDVCIGSPEISRRHCLLAWTGKQLTVEDLTSANGTFLNDRRVQGTQPMKSGDQLRIGPITFTVDVQSTKSAMQALNASVEADARARPGKQQEVIDVVPLAPDSKADKPVPPAPPQKAVASAEGEDELGDTRMVLPEGKDFHDFLSQMEE